MTPLGGSDCARVIGGRRARPVAQIDHDDLVADPVHFDIAVVGERAHRPYPLGQLYMANAGGLARWWFICVGGPHPASGPMKNAQISDMARTARRQVR